MKITSLLPFGRFRGHTLKRHLQKVWQSTDDLALGELGIFNKNVNMFSQRKHNIADKWGCSARSLPPTLPTHET